ncbi:MAG: hypothetical protein AB1774_04260 [Bacillota bacterium]
MKLEMYLGRLARRQPVSLSLVIKILDLVGTLLFLISAILALAVPDDVPPVPGSEQGTPKGVSQNAVHCGDGASNA